MIYSGQSINVELLDGGIAEFKFDLRGESVNKFDRATLEDLGAAVTAVKADAGVKGLIVTSGKGVFIVGADITEFVDLFKHDEEAIAHWCTLSNAVFNSFEDLPVPTVCAINGFALGGGLEMALCCDYRIMSNQAQVGFPEVKLGIYPGFGGTVRLPRVSSPQTAVEWICTGGQHRANKALEDGVVDAVVEPDVLRQCALDLVKQCIAGERDFQSARGKKLLPLGLPEAEASTVFEALEESVSGRTGSNFPAPLAALKAMQANSGMARDAALRVEGNGFAKIARTPQATAMVGVFLADQAVKTANRSLSQGAMPVNQAATLGAGIMGGGIAHLSALKGTPVVMKDIADAALDLGMSQASKLLSKRVSRGQMAAEKMDAILSSIHPTQSYDEFGTIDVVIEAIVENEAIKQSVLTEAEAVLKDNALLASNTSTISITRLASTLERPENFAGMHFFNPVHMMPLVEVIRGEKTSPQTIATLVAYATKLGKNPIVVNDCPGFLVNRVLFPYFAGFSMLLRDGADLQAVDRAMEAFGWPMGPAYLMDVIGVDTCVHCVEVMAQGFPDRMQYDFKDMSQVMFENQRLGQKNGVGFYKYEADSKGRKQKTVDEASYALIKPHVAEAAEFDESDIVARMMVPLCTEIVRCLEDNIVGSAAEADMALIHGISFPVFRGGALRHIDSIGVRQFVDLCDKYAHLGRIYEAPQLLKDMAASGRSFFG
ncbi:MAG: fatty acid oxidation complex subunit alpha FadB [Halieaceae bacterium]|jgi:3-hydroxyacyl-CoA dehydrogenase / enoyl-CoA hydratase / 3-hydroxybutyryl-CoA epimerase / enoyl-CoA isomerase|nr:fatty acid oxidation complex subunit alpha FadB [Halieaceae bacterium]